MYLKKILLAVETALLAVLILSLGIVVFSKSKVETSNKEDPDYIDNTTLNATTNNNEEEEENTAKYIKLVQDRNAYFAAEKCASNYLNYVKDKKVDAIYDLLDDAYKTQFGITKENILEGLPQFDQYQTYTAKTIYTEAVNQYTDKYYIYGSTKNEEIARQERPSPSQDMMMTVILNKRKMAYTVMPNGYMFSNKVNNVSSNNNVTITVNEFVTYMDHCEITIAIENNSNTEFRASGNAISMKYYEMQDPVTLNGGEIKVEAGTKQEVKLVFHNDVKTPKQLMINQDTGSFDIPIIKDYIKKG